MSGYVRSSEFSIEFDGETVRGNLKPLSLPDLLRMQAVDVANDEAAAKVLAEILPAYVTDFIGPKAKDGSAVPIEEVCSVAYFLGLSMDIGRRLVSTASPPQKPSSPSAS